MGALEERRAQLSLEQLHLLGERGLTDSQIFGGASEPTQTGYANKILELAQVDGRPSYSSW